jgi:hypothetical protein
MNRLVVFRALSAVFASKLLTLAKWILVGGSALILVLVWLLATYVDPLWWLLLIFFIPLVIIGGLVYLLARFISRKLYPKTITQSQRGALNDFIDKLLRVLEARSIPPVLIAGIVVKDLVLYRDLKTLRGLLNDTGSLKADFAQLEKQLSTDA